MVKSSTFLHWKWRRKLSNFIGFSFERIFSFEKKKKEKKVIQSQFKCRKSNLNVISNAKCIESHVDVICIQFSAEKEKREEEKAEKTFSRLLRYSKW